ncbi:hypothetical protein PQX77_013982 [Marasmius sp. AFHP31]|nr:hypothetical protein PQX77_013982 [Marasmius sp. AFHP31]
MSRLTPIAVSVWVNQRSQLDDDMPDTTKLPGFGLPVNILPRSTLENHSSSSKSVRLCFPNAITSWLASNILVREQTMLSMMNKITEKPEWDRKVNDETIVVKWKNEALSREGVDFSEAMFNYCIAELREKASYFSQTGRAIVLDAEAAIVKSDTAIPASLCEELKAAHPGSDEKVLDLVHPSLYPLIYGKSRVLPSGHTTLSDYLERWLRDDQWVRDNRILIKPEPGDYSPNNRPAIGEILSQVDLKREWKEQGLQIIVKLANIELRPEEGKTSALYYYDQSNITESRLAFRQLTNEEELPDKRYLQNDYEGLEAAWSVIAEFGHGVQSFELADPSKPGYRKILALFLVDPYIRTLSTALPLRRKIGGGMS